MYYKNIKDKYLNKLNKYLNKLNKNCISLVTEKNLIYFKFYAIEWISSNSFEKNFFFYIIISIFFI